MPRWAISRSYEPTIPIARTLRAIDEARPGSRWAQLQHDLGPGYRRWFLGEGDAARPSHDASRKAMEVHMPELLPVYDQLVTLAGGSDIDARMLSLWCPPAYLTGCSQAVWLRDPAFMIRNYDYHPALWDGVLLASSWTGRRVIGMLDSLWGVLDGINEDGLAVSLAFGGRPAVGPGFGMPLILRYVLETCRTVAEGTAMLARVPSHMSYNVTLLDATGDHATVFVAPDRPAAVTRRRVATNHQRIDEWPAFAQATATADRESVIQAQLARTTDDPGRFIERFLEPPLHQLRFHHGWGTLYTAIYRPGSTAMTLRWPGLALDQSIDNFHETAVALSFTGHSRERIEA